MRWKYAKCIWILNNKDKEKGVVVFDNKQFFKDLLTENLKERQKDLALKIKKRQTNKVQMKKLADYIIDFVEEIYKYQTERNSEEIKIEDWRNWSSMFMNNQPFSVSLKSNISYFEHEKTTEQNENEEKKLETSNKIFNNNINKNENSIDL